MKFMAGRVGNFVLFSFILTKLSAQTLPDSVTRKVDSLFHKWNTSNSLGCAIGIVRNDSLIYAKGYGLANLEYGIPITPETIFNMGSISKQFTAFGIVLLAKQGKIKLDEDIHTYLAWVPDFGKKITVQNLLNHTSGLREHTKLASISGLGIDGALTPNISLNLLKRQTALNFNPGDRYSYCNSNYILLAEIIKSVSGKPFREFEDSAIFKPLGMTHSHFHDNYTELIPNRAASYAKTAAKQYVNNFQSIYTVGPGGLLSNIHDMSKWIMNYYSFKVGDQKDIQQLTQRGKLNSGKELSYALGVRIGSYKGWREYWHGGHNAGYANFITILPDLKMGFVFLSNTGDANSSAKGREIVSLFIKDTTIKSGALKNANRDSTNAVLKDTSFIKNFIGNYIDDEGEPLRFEIKEGKLYSVFGSRAAALLIQEKKDSFSLKNFPSVKYIFSIKPKDTSVVVLDANETIRFKKYVIVNQKSEKLLKEYIGTYFSSELDCIYKIALKDHQLVLVSPKYNDAKLTLTNNDQLISKDYEWIRYLRIMRDNKNKVSGFELNSLAVMHLRFDKIK